MDTAGGSNIKAALKAVEPKIPGSTPGSDKKEKTLKAFSAKSPSFLLN